MIDNMVACSRVEGRSALQSWRPFRVAWVNDRVITNRLALVAISPIQEHIHKFLWLLHYINEISTTWE